MGDLQLSIKPNANVAYRIVKETPHFLVIEKPAGVVTQPGRKHQTDALLNGLFVKYGKALQNLGKKRFWSASIDSTEPQVVLSSLA